MQKGANKAKDFDPLLAGLRRLDTAPDMLLRLNAARFYEAFQEWNRALAVYRLVIAEKPGTPAADASLYRMAAILARLGEQADAVKYAARISSNSAIPLAEVRNNWRCELLREIEDALQSLAAMRLWKDFFASQRTLPDALACADAQRAWLRLMRETAPRLAGLVSARGYKFLPVVHRLRSRRIRTDSRRSHRLPTVSHRRTASSSAMRPPCVTAF